MPDLNPTDLAAKTLAHYDADDTLMHDEAPTDGSNVRANRRQ